MINNLPPLKKCVSTLATRLISQCKSPTNEKKYGHATFDIKQKNSQMIIYCFTNHNQL